MPNNTIRIQYQKINWATLIVGAVVAGLVALVSFGHLAPDLSAIVTGLSVAAAIPLSRFLITKFGAGTPFMPTGPFIESTRRRTDSDILLDEFIRLGGHSARKAASTLENNIGDKSIVLSADPLKILKATEEYFKQEGVLLEDDSTEPSNVVKGILGCGTRKLNPTLVSVTLSTGLESSEVAIRGVAKEGLIKQRAGEEAADALEQYLLKQFESNI